MLFRSSMPKRKQTVYDHGHLLLKWRVLSRGPEKGGFHPLTSSIPLIERDKHRTGSRLVHQKRGIGSHECLTRSRGQTLNLPITSTQLTMQKCTRGGVSSLNLGFTCMWERRFVRGSPPFLHKRGKGTFSEFAARMTAQVFSESLRQS